MKPRNKRQPPKAKSAKAYNTKWRQRLTDLINRDVSRVVARPKVTLPKVNIRVVEW